MSEESGKTKFRDTKAGRVIHWIAGVGAAILCIVIAIVLIRAADQAIRDGGGLKFKVNGQCMSTRHGGILYGSGSGFKPYEQYDITVYRNGHMYGDAPEEADHYYLFTGQADALGHPTYFTWPCDYLYYGGVHEIALPGHYKVTLKSLRTGKSVSATFNVLKPRSTATK